MTMMYPAERQERAIGLLGVYMLGLIAAYASIRSNENLLRWLQSAVITHAATGEPITLLSTLDAIMVLWASFCFIMVFALIDPNPGGRWRVNLTAVAFAFFVFSLIFVFIPILAAIYWTASLVAGPIGIDPLFVIAAGVIIYLLYVRHARRRHLPS